MLFCPGIKGKGLGAPGGRGERGANPLDELMSKSVIPRSEATWESHPKSTRETATAYGLRNDLGSRSLSLREWICQIGIWRRVAADNSLRAAAVR